MPAVYIKTYGCQMNERDSEQVAEQLRAKGYEIASSEDRADVILLNTCSVRDLAEQKALGKMNSLKHLRRKNPNLVLGFMGCMAQSRGQELVDKLPDVDLVVGTQQFHRTGDYVDQIYHSRKLGSYNGQPIVDTREEAGSQNTIKDHLPKEKQVTAFVSIMQGCNMHCTFCIVPSTRGAERGRPIPEIVQEVRMLVDRGVKEVTLLGQIVNLYGRHEFPKVDGKSPFVQMLYALEEIEGLERIRFTSPHPVGFREDLIRAFGELNKLCEHVHLPVQSGSDRILKAMHRPYTAEKYKRLTDRLREVNPEMAISTDIIVGFPGETEEDHLQTCKLVEEVGFDQGFIFKYSERRDTPAASMEDQVPQEVKEARNQELLGMIDDRVKKKTEALVGSTVEILVEGPSRRNPNRLSGRTRTNKIVIFEGNSRHHGELLNVRICETTGYTLYGDPAIHALEPVEHICP